MVNGMPRGGFPGMGGGAKPAAADAPGAENAAGHAENAGRNGDNGI